MEVVHEVATSDNENTLLAQRRYAIADLVVERRRLRLVDAELHDRNVRLRVNLESLGSARCRDKESR